MIGPGKLSNLFNGDGPPNNSLVCPESCRLLTGESPVVVTARGPRSRQPVQPGDWLC